MQLILGSQSPRRREILGFFSHPFEQFSSHFAEELIPFEGDPIAYAETLSKGKAASLAPDHPLHVILTADTVVYIDGTIMNKPRDEEEGLAMLRQLNGSWHTVYTAVTAQRDDHAITTCAETRVLFHKVPEETLKTYHASFHGADKAGGYGIQMAGSIIVKRMEGCFYNVMGLPISETCDVLREQGIDLWHYLD